MRKFHDTDAESTHIHKDFLEYYSGYIKNRGVREEAWIEMLDEDKWGLCYSCNLFYKFPRKVYEGATIENNDPEEECSDSDHDN